MKFVNLTPHDIVVFNQNGMVTLKVPASGQIARVTTTKDFVKDLSGVPVYTIAYGDVDGLPAPQDGVIYIVSALVAQAVAGKRLDVVAPDTSDPVRDKDGRIIGVKGFITF
jgi:hypothetical protein